MNLICFAEKRIYIYKLTSLTLSAKKEYGDSPDFFSTFLPCSRRSAAVRKAEFLPELANVFELPFVGELLLLPLDFLFFFGSSSSSSPKSSSSSEEVTPDRREAPERREDEIYGPHLNFGIGRYNKVVIVIRSFRACSACINNQ